MRSKFKLVDGLIVLIPIVWLFGLATIVVSIFIAIHFIVKFW